MHRYNEYPDTCLVIFTVYPHIRYYITEYKLCTDRTFMYNIIRCHCKNVKWNDVVTEHYEAAVFEVAAAST